MRTVQPAGEVLILPTVSDDLFLIFADLAPTNNKVAVFAGRPKDQKQKKEMPLKKQRLHLLRQVHMVPLLPESQGRHFSSL